MKTCLLSESKVCDSKKNEYCSAGKVSCELMCRITLTQPMGQCLCSWCSNLGTMVRKAKERKGRGELAK